MLLLRPFCLFNGGDSCHIVLKTRKVVRWATLAVIFSKILLGIYKWEKEKRFSQLFKTSYLFIYCNFCLQTIDFPTFLRHLWLWLVSGLLIYFLKRLAGYQCFRQTIPDFHSRHHFNKEPNKTAVITLLGFNVKCKCKQRN